MFKRIFFLSFLAFFLFSIAAQAAAPGNDNQANAQIVSGTVGGAGGTTIDATREQSELNHIYPGIIYRTVWYKWTAPETKPTYFKAINLENGFDAAIGVYAGNPSSSSIVAYNNDSSGDDISFVEFAATAGTTYTIVVGVYNSANAAGGQFSLNFEQTNHPFSDDFIDSRTLAFPSGNVVGTNFNATNEPNEPARISNNDKSVWFHITNPTNFDRSLTFDTIGSLSQSLNSTLSVYTGTTLQTLTPVVQNDNISSAQKSRVTFLAKAGVTYRIAVDTKTGTPTGNFSLRWDPTKIGYNTDFGSRNAATAEVFYDDATDITVFRPSNGTWYSLDSTTNNFNAFQFGASGDAPVPADYDGDGRTDFAVTRNRVGGKFWHISNSFDNSYKVVQWGVATDKVVPGDYDLDGRMDIAVFRPSSGVWYILRSSDGGATIKQFGVNGDIPVLGDFAGTSLGSDLAVFRPSNGIWYIANGNNFIARQFGQNGDKPVAAHFDIDGKTDIGVYRPSDGVWYYIESNSNTFKSVQWGISSDIPQVGDFDTNNNSGNAADFVVYRPGDGTWYIRKNNSLGNTEAVQFGLSDDIPASSLANVSQ